MAVPTDARVLFHPQGRAWRSRQIAGLSLLLEEKSVLPLPAAVEGSALFPQRSENTRNCWLPLPVADEGSQQFPQPRHWRAVAKQAREWHCGKVDSAQAQSVFRAPQGGGDIRRSPREADGG